MRALAETLTIPDQGVVRIGNDRTIKPVGDKRYGIPKVQIHVQDTCVYSVNGVLNAAYRTGEDVNGLPPLRTESRQFGIAGRGPDLAPDITQTVPSPAKILGVTMEVAF